MIKTRLIVGDIHGRFNDFKKVYDKIKPNDVIILGDYVDTHDLISDEQIQESFDMIMKLKSEHTNGLFITLFGNHDFHYLYNNTYIEKYSGYNHKTHQWAYNRFKEEVINGNLQMLYVDEVNKIIYSHAGVTSVWFENHDFTSFNEINESFKKLELESFKFTYGDYYAGGVLSSTGDNPCNSSIWVRPMSLLEKMYPGYKQIVGHTPTKTHQPIGFTKSFETYTEENFGKTDLILCDCLPHACLLQELDDNKIISYKIIDNN